MRDVTELLAIIMIFGVMPSLLIFIIFIINKTKHIEKLIVPTK
jgi:hypothetical protein